MKKMIIFTFVPILTAILLVFNPCDQLKGAEVGNCFKNVASSKGLMNRLNFSFFCLLIAIMPMLFTACDKNNGSIEIIDGSIEVIDDHTGANSFMIEVNSVKNGTNEIASVNSFGISYYSPDNEWYFFEFAAKYKNGGFTLNFPVTIPDEYLYPLSERIVMEENIQLSDIHAKITSVMFLALNNAKADIGNFSFRSANWTIDFIYADRNFTEKGVSLYGVECDCSYKKGWNIVYTSINSEISDAGSLKTTQKPLNENFICYFFPNIMK